MKTRSAAVILAVLVSLAGCGGGGSGSLSAAQNKAGNLTQGASGQNQLTNGSATQNSGMDITAMGTTFVAIGQSLRFNRQPVSGAVILIKRAAGGDPIAQV